MIHFNCPHVQYAKKIVYTYYGSEGVIFYEHGFGISIRRYHKNNTHGTADVDNGGMLMPV
ncbi:hypothetical protein BRADI_4g41613v3 [Brachypodium distachyon]|uniref:Uncharacterized protein n=1 Tax=Brachypodium distachyon TaxID=15368 RepID=A0A2K2CTP1_BRADI|nr:hypothetical protein BRADI_4g41613v3 [Brachypodium distachyon]